MINIHLRKCYICNSRIVSNFPGTKLLCIATDKMHHYELVISKHSGFHEIIYIPDSDLMIRAYYGLMVVNLKNQSLSIKLNKPIFINGDYIKELLLLA